jgi:hypothetical protein
VEKLDTVVAEIRKQRNEIMRAFIARYNMDPADMEQICEVGPDTIRWYVQKRDRRRNLRQLIESGKLKRS